jgi:hypothetical protein
MGYRPGDDKIMKAPLAMHPALRLPLHQSGALQCLLHPGVAQPDLVLLAQLLVKMTHVQIEIPVPVKPQNLLHLRHRNALAAGCPAPPIHQPVTAVLLVPLSPATHLTVADADDLRRLKPGQLPRHGPQYHFLYLHRPLHCGPRIALHACSHETILAARYADTSLASTTRHIMCH